MGPSSLRENRYLCCVISELKSDIHLFMFLKETERKRKIDRLLQSMCNEKEGKRAFCINQVQGWVNRIVHTSTGMTPEFVHFRKISKNELVASVQDRYLITELAHKGLLTKAQKRQFRFSRQNKLTEFWLEIRI